MMLLKFANHVGTHATIPSAGAHWASDTRFEVRRDFCLRGVSVHRLEGNGW